MADGRHQRRTSCSYGGESSSCIDCFETHGIYYRGLDGREDPASRSKDKDIETEELTEGLMGRLALDESWNFDADGELQYFGPTSGETSVRALSGCQFNRGNSRAPGQYEQLCDLDDLDPADQIAIELGVSKLVQDNLHALYFRWEQLWFAEIDEELFRESMHYGGRYWSPLLHLAILAMDSRYSDNLQVRSNLNESNTAGSISIPKFLTKSTPSERSYACPDEGHKLARPPMRF
ncbi:uncharacterized protein BDV14DRAFT_206110 [Aspergillus stella-maris]|uniref:uncharacterized protein n=1 Tax=Aspergillus stella-maris TaxID=1810926 RepID=UPI003CCDB66F